MKRTPAESNGFSDKWICEKQEISEIHYALKGKETNMKENRCFEGHFPQVVEDLESQTSQAVSSKQMEHSDQRQVQNQSKIKEFQYKQKQLIPRIKLPFPPSTPKNKDHDAMPTFRQRKFRVDCPGSPLSEAREIRVKNRFPVTISVDTFPVTGNPAPYSWSTDSNDEECNKNDVEGEKEVRNNVEGLLGLNSPMSRLWDSVTTSVTSISNSHIYKSRGPHPIDSFAQRPLEWNAKLCRQKLELADSFDSQRGKDSALARQMIKNWLTDVNIRSK